MNEKYTLEQLRQVKGIGEKTIQRIVEQFDDSEYISKYDPNIHIEPNTLVHGDMLEVMNGIPDKSIDMILTDLPYGTTACSWDTVIPFDKMWKQYNRVIKDNGAIVLFGSEPFSSRLRMSNIDNYKYDWVWEKSKSGNPLVAKFQPLKRHENIMVFNAHNVYRPIMTKGEPYKRKFTVHSKNNMKFGIKGAVTDNKGTRYPLSILKFQQKWRRQDQIHPTQKPIELLEYLIKTYTQEGELVLDSTMGSGSTGVACINTNRNFIGIEIDDKYFEIAKQRISEAQNKPDGRR